MVQQFYWTQQTWTTLYFLRFSFYSKQNVFPKFCRYLIGERYNTSVSLERQPLKEQVNYIQEKKTNSTVFLTYLLFKLSNVQVTFSVCIYLENLLEMN